MGLSLMKFTYCRMVSALILPMILANKPFVIFGAPDKPCGVGRADANPKLLLNDT